ncbi:type ISP restriction/modification enzyme [Halospina sp. K52047b]|uniref:DEAD/DEAH box helicase n=1 Tax=Halospina sp. K52047b TaxID=2614160 RepID=UPI00124A4411|nr:type ISP restriction/modification enzyme [Halospina sp. K52047b]KAA8976139.1 DEAD/DEAH box helicase [Halospina sp. K52047b]
MARIEDVLQQMREDGADNRILGNRFERLIRNYLLTDPQYANELTDVWLWSEWPQNWGQDVGIDLVARTHTGDYWAIQCKFHLPDHTIQKGDIDSFFTASGRSFEVNGERHTFSQRVIVSSTNRWSSLAESALTDQNPPVERISLSTLDASPIDWGQFNPFEPERMVRREGKTLRPHQREAKEATEAHFQNQDRGKLIMACGTGKTFAALRIMESVVAAGGRVLFLAPSISLVSQTLREWASDAEMPFNAFAVCSDSGVGRDQDDIPVHDLAYPATTDPFKLAGAMSAHEQAKPERSSVVFSTYHSIDVIRDAQSQGIGVFDLVICDEAHRTTGITLAEDKDDSSFVKVHSNENVEAAKRLYMTATPRIFGNKSRERAEENQAVLYSMDDPERYGTTIYELNFGEAVRRGLLTDYRVLLVAVDEDKMPELANTYQASLDEGEDAKAIDTQFVAKILGTWKGLAKEDVRLVGEEGEDDVPDVDRHPMKRAVAFASSIKNSKTLTEVFPKLISLYHREHTGHTNPLECDLQHVDGKMNALARQNALEWLNEGDPESERCRILSNARCLSEGIDVPALDSVIFFDTRDSTVDIVQSVGRVMRKDAVKAPDKEYGYIILPVSMPAGELTNYDRYIDQDPQFKGVWKVIKALRAHDERLVDEAEFRRKIRVVGRSGGGGDADDEGDDTPDQFEFGFENLPIGDISEHIYAAIPRKLGDRDYWHDWARDVANIAQNIIARIEALLENPDAREAFDEYWKGLRENLNPGITEHEAIEMLAQHRITQPVFDALFPDRSFIQENPVSRSIQRVTETLNQYRLDSETNKLERFYEQIRNRAALAQSEKSRQDLIKGLYESFFRSAFEDMAGRLGIVYTPVEIVDFIIQSANDALQDHFNCGLSDENVHILDPFSGTGTFITRLLQHENLIRGEDLTRKYQQELHANEIVLLAYYVAAVNIESAFRGRVHTDEEQGGDFPGIVLTDTFQMSEGRDMVDHQVLPENNARVEHQNEQPIQVIVGNPPYSGTQGGTSYDRLDRRIEETYAYHSRSQLKNSLYDSYIRAFRWASDRIGDKGVIAFVSNGGWIDGDATAGFRKCVQDDFSEVYVFHLRGNQRTSGELSRREGGKVFGQGSRAPVAITLLIKDPDHTGPAKIHFHDIGDYLTREQKLELITSFGGYQGIPWDTITPNDYYDWINQRNDKFYEMKPLTADRGGIFTFRSRGVATSRDSWAYNSSSERLKDNALTQLGVYHSEIDRLSPNLSPLQTATERFNYIKENARKEPTQVKWDREMYQCAARQKREPFDNSRIVVSQYRPFFRQWFYNSKVLSNNRYQMPSIFPTPNHGNLLIQVPGTSASNPFSCLITDTIPDLNALPGGSQCLPLNYYEKPDQSKQDLFDNPSDEYVRRDAITDAALHEIRAHYGDDTINKEAIFYYTYGLLHSPEYREKFGVELKKELPRIPYAPAFWAFSQAGRDLAYWHLNYETVEPYPLDEHSNALAIEPEQLYKVHKMRFAGQARSPDKSTVVVNNHVTLSGIPDEAHQYIVNGKSALEWVMERYQWSKDKTTGIVNDPNEWSDDPRYIVDLVKRVVRVSVETVRLTNNLPALESS